MTPMMQQYFEIKEQHKDSILFFRLGDFYEMFYEDAKLVSSLLDLTLTARNAGGGKKAPLCGIPYHSADKYIAELVAMGHSVAICEQVEDPTQTKDIVKREVIKIITKGTITDPQMLNENENNYIASICYKNNSYAITYADLSTFSIEACSFTSHKDLLNELALINPSEVLIHKEYKNIIPNNYLVKILDDKYFDDISADSTISLFNNLISNISALELDLKFSLGALLSYILETQLININTKFTYKLLSKDKYLIIDNNSKRNLELFSTIRDNSQKGSLEWVLNNTITKMGSRLLKNYIRKPLCDKKEINSRLDFVEYFYKSDIYRDNIRDELKNIYDIERLIAKLIFSNIMPKDLLKLGYSLNSIPIINEHLANSGCKNIEMLKEYNSLSKKIISVINEDTKTTLKDGGVINKGVNDELDELIYIQENASKYLIDIETELKEETGIKNLRIKYNKVFGYFIEVTNSYLNLVPDYFIRKQTLVGSERYFTEELKEIEIKIISAKDKRIALENKIYNSLLDEVKKFADNIILTARKIAKIDVLLGFSLLSKTNNYVKPTFTNNTEIIIEKGRHPVIEKIIGESDFISNNLFINGNNDQFLIITGPNMAGKSTFLRQTALITIMAQMGCFVPADKAKLCIVDKVFTRVGASDNLSSGESTFLVEMNELSHILSNATNKSLVILDEIGRGTSTYDGLSIAWSTVEYLTDKNLHPMTIFATHYHELTEIEDRIQGVKNYRISIKEFEDQLIFLRKIVPGKAMQSYGIEAAKLAGLPNKLIERAKDILEDLEENDIVKVNNKKNREKKNKPNNTKLFNYIDSIDVNSTTPIEALNIIQKIKELKKYE